MLQQGQHCAWLCPAAIEPPPLALCRPSVGSAKDRSREDLQSSAGRQAGLPCRMSNRKALLEQLGYRDLQAIAKECGLKASG